MKGHEYFQILCFNIKATYNDFKNIPKQKDSINGGSASAVMYRRR
jgi:hypothetical protein